MGLDINNLYDELWDHREHYIEMAYYGNKNMPDNIAIECIDCMYVLIDADKPA